MYWIGIGSMFWLEFSWNRQDCWKRYADSKEGGIQGVFVHGVCVFQINHAQSLSTTTVQDFPLWFLVFSAHTFISKIIHYKVGVCIAYSPSLPSPPLPPPKSCSSKKCVTLMVCVAHTVCMRYWNNFHTVIFKNNVFSVRN